MSTCPIIRIKSGVDWTPFFVINEADFDPVKHERLDAPAEPAGDGVGSAKAVAVKAVRAAKKAEPSALPEAS